MIEFACPHCSRQMRVSDSAVGKSGTCNGCGQRVRVPQPRMERELRSIEPEVILEADDTPVPQFVVAPTTNVVVTRERPTSNSLGIASLVFAVLAFPLSWIPFINILTIPLSCLALLMGGAGFLIAVFRKGTGIGFSFAGTALALICLIFTWSSNQAASDALNAMRQADVQRQDIAPAVNNLPAALPADEDAAPADDAKVGKPAKADDVRAPAKNVAQEKKLPLELLAWDFSVVKGDFGDHYKISYSLKNQGDCAILGKLR